MKISNIKVTLLMFAALCVASLAFYSLAQENTTSDKNIFLDSDQDGLSDDEEKAYGTDVNNRDTDGDGYTDGVEVKSGYDPLKPAPGDKIVQSSNIKVQGSSGNANDQNLTQEVSEEVANLITQKAGENQEIALEDLDAIIQKTTGETLTFEDLPAIDEKEINVKEQNYSRLSDEKRAEKEKEDALEYLVAVSYILINNSPQKITEAKDLENFTQEIVIQVELFSISMNNTKYFNDLADKGESVLEQLKGLEVPEKLLDYHIKGMKMAKYAISLREEAAMTSDDPIANIANLSKVQNLINLSIEFSDNISSNLSKLGISEIPIEL